MVHRAVSKVTRNNPNDVIATVILAGPLADAVSQGAMNAGSQVTADAGSLVTVFVSQPGGAWALGSATVPSDGTEAAELDVTATVQSSDPQPSQFTEGDALTVTSHVTAIWTSTLPPDPDQCSNGTTVWATKDGPAEPEPPDGV